MAAEFTRFSETILTKQDQRVVSITVKPVISDCTGWIYFTDLMVQEGDRLTGYVIHTETLLQKYRENGALSRPGFITAWCARRKRWCCSTSAPIRRDWTAISTRYRTWRLAAFPWLWARAHTRQLSLLR